MSKRIIVDCEQDVKGLHEWKPIAPSQVWCFNCGAVGRLENSGLNTIKVIRRVKEK